MKYNKILKSQAYIKHKQVDFGGDLKNTALLSQ